MLKRTIDILASFVLLIAFVPLFILIAILIKLDSPGSVLFFQDRTGLNGRIFRIVKFRSMTNPQKLKRITDSGSRVTGIGRIIRSTFIDELPQLYCVLIGNMSLVGPRPEMPHVAQRYTQLQIRRLKVKPGITGLWQISGLREFPIHENIKYDLYYIRKWSNKLDLWVIAMTFLTLFDFRRIRNEWQHPLSSRTRPNSLKFNRQKWTPILGQVA